MKKQGRLEKWKASVPEINLSLHMGHANRVFWTFFNPSYVLNTADHTSCCMF